MMNELVLVLFVTCSVSRHASNYNQGNPKNTNVNIIQIIQIWEKAFVSYKIAALRHKPEKKCLKVSILAF